MDSFIYLLLTSQNNLKQFSSQKPNWEAIKKF